jgi:hypothetical protein
MPDYSIAFLVSNRTHVETYDPIIDALPSSAEPTYIVDETNPPWYRQGAREEIIKREHPHVELTVTHEALESGDSIRAKLQRHRQLKRVAQSVLMYLNTDVLVVPNDKGGFNEHIIERANEQNIPSILVHWAFTGTEGKDSSRGLLSTTGRKLLEYVGVLPDEVTFYGTGETTVACVTGEYYEELFVRKGGDRDKYVVTGNPRYDFLTDLIKRDREALAERFRQRHGIESGVPLLTIATQPLDEFEIATQEEYEQWIRDALGVVDTTEMAYHPVVKLHPREGAKKRVLIKEIANSAIVLQNEVDVFELIHASRALVSGLSTTVLEAILLETPAIIYDPLEDADEFGFKTLTPARTREDLRSELAQIADDQDRKNLLREQQSFAHRRVANRDGRAAIAIAEIIDELAMERWRQNPKF